MNGADVGGRKRGAVGAVADFLGVVGVGGQIRAKCLCYNKRKMFHVTLFELFRAASDYCDFARSFTVTLEKSVGRFRSMVGDCVWGGATDRFILARIIMVVMMRLSGGAY